MPLQEKMRVAMEAADQEERLRVREKKESF